MEPRHKEPIQEPVGLQEADREAVTPGGAVAGAEHGVKSGVGTAAARLRAQRSLSPEGHRSSSLPPPAHRNIPPPTPSTSPHKPPSQHRPADGMKAVTSFLPFNYGEWSVQFLITGVSVHESFDQRCAILFHPAKRETLLMPLSAKSSPKRCPTENYSTAFGCLMPREEHLLTRSETHISSRK